MCSSRCCRPASRSRNLDWGEVYKTCATTGADAVDGWRCRFSLVYCFFDVLGKRYARHDLPVRQILPVTFVCYAFNLNLSAWVGGIALRFRLYSRLGLKPAQITRVFTMSILTNWLGYMWLAGSSSPWAGSSRRPAGRSASPPAW